MQVIIQAISAQLVALFYKKMQYLILKMQHILLKIIILLICSSEISVVKNTFSHPTYDAIEVTDGQAIRDYVMNYCDNHNLYGKGLPILFDFSTYDYLIT